MQEFDGTFLVARFLQEGLVEFRRQGFAVCKIRAILILGHKRQNLGRLSELGIYRQCFGTVFAFSVSASNY